MSNSLLVWPKNLFLKKKYDSGTLIFIVAFSRKPSTFWAGNLYDNTNSSLRLIQAFDFIQNNPFEDSLSNRKCFHAPKNFYFERKSLKTWWFIIEDKTESDLPKLGDISSWSLGIRNDFLNQNFFLSKILPELS